MSEHSTEQQQSREEILRVANVCKSFQHAERQDLHVRTINHPAEMPVSHLADADEAQR